MQPPALPQLAGVDLATAASGIKYAGRDDLLLVRLSAGSQVAGVFTRSATAGAPVNWCRQQLGRGHSRALLVNAGNANVFTGRIGEQHVRQCCAAVATALACEREDVLVASTGVIGEYLPVEKIIQQIPHLHAALPAAPTGSTAAQWHAAAQAIMTTDTVAKLASRQTQIGTTPVTLNGIAKGSGMIAPDMATMLAFVFTDARLPASVLQPLLTQANHDSFNAISVDGDTSTSDTVLLFATGQAAHTAPRNAQDPELNAFAQALSELMQDLALQVVRDGEGAHKLLQVEVGGAENDHAARLVAKSIIDSPLVKTALGSEDANWGRIIMAVGKAGQTLDQHKLTLHLGGVAVVSEGRPRADYSEVAVAEHLQQDQLSIQVDLGVGPGFARVWGCDLTHAYIDINANYRT